MGVDIQTYRAKIGTYRHSFGVDVITQVVVINFCKGLKYVGCVLFIGILLIMAGVEQNPGPRNHDNAQVNEPLETTKIKVTEVSQTITKEDIELFFQEQGWGEMKEVTEDTIDKSVIIEFVDAKAVDAILQQLPICIAGTTVTVERFDERCDPDECKFDPDALQSDEAGVENIPSTKIRVTGLPKGATNEVLIMFFENEKRQGGGRVKDVILVDEGNSAIVDFEDASAVDKVMQNKPINILGHNVNVEVFVADDSASNARPTKIEVIGLPKGITDEILTMFFENEHRQGGGPVKCVTIDDDKHVGVIEFEEPEAVETVMQKQPIVICDTQVKIQIIRQQQLETEEVIKTIKVSGLPKTVTDEILLMFFENEKRQGGGKVTEIRLNKKEESALVEFEEEKAVRIVLEKQPIRILGQQVRVEKYMPISKPVRMENTKICVTGLPDTITDEVLIMFFENEKRQGGGKVVEVVIDKVKRCAIIEFETPTAVIKVLQNRPISIFGTEVNVDTYDPAKNDRKLLVSGLPGNISTEFLTMFFEHENGYGGGPVKHVKITEDKQKAIIEFEEKKSVDIVLKKQPISIQETVVQVSLFDPDYEDEASESTAIKVSGLPGHMSAEFLELIFENVKRQGGGKVMSVEINEKSKYAIIEFEDKQAVETVLQKRPILIEKKEVTVEVYTKCPRKILTGTETRKLIISDLPRNVTEEYLTIFFESEERKGGGKVKHVELNIDDLSAIIEFEEQRALTTVLEKRPIALSGKTITVEIFAENEDPKAILVCDLQDNVTEELLITFFENESTQGGGKVKALEINKYRNFAIVEFENPLSARKVLQKKPISISGCEVDVCVFNGSNCLEVRGFDTYESENDLLDFFENVDLSSGENVEKLHIDRNNEVAYLTFQANEVAKRVCDRKTLTYKQNINLVVNTCLHREELTEGSPQMSSERKRQYMYQEERNDLEDAQYCSDVVQSDKVLPSRHTPAVTLTHDDQRSGQMSPTVTDRKQHLDTHESDTRMSQQQQNEDSGTVNTQATVLSLRQRFETLTQDDERRSGQIRPNVKSSKKTLGKHESITQISQQKQNAESGAAKNTVQVSVEQQPTVNTGKPSDDKMLTCATDLTIQGDSHNCKTGKLNDLQQQENKDVQKCQLTAISGHQEHFSGNITDKTREKLYSTETCSQYDSPRSDSKKPPMPAKKPVRVSVEQQPTVNSGEQSGDKRRTGATDLTIQGDSNDCKTGKLNIQKEECTTILEPQEHLNRNIAEETSIKQNMAKTDLLHDRRQSQTPPVPAKNTVQVSVEQQPTVNTGKPSDDKMLTCATDLTIQGDSHNCKTGKLNDLQQQENKDVQKCQLTAISGHQEHFSGNITDKTREKLYSTETCSQYDSPRSDSKKPPMPAKKPVRVSVEQQPTVNSGEQSGDKRRTGATDLTIQGDSNDCKTGKLNIQKEECTTILEPQEHLNRNIAEETSIKQNMAKTDLLHDRRQSQTPPVPEERNDLEDAQYCSDVVQSDKVLPSRHTPAVTLTHDDQRSGQMSPTVTDRKQHLDTHESDTRMSQQQQNEDSGTVNTQATVLSLRQRFETLTQDDERRSGQIRPNVKSSKKTLGKHESITQISQQKQNAESGAAKNTIQVAVEQQPTVNTGKPSDDKMLTCATDLTIQGDSHDCKTGKLNDLQQQENKDVQKCQLTAISGHQEHFSGNITDKTREKLYSTETCSQYDSPRSDSKKPPMPAKKPVRVSVEQQPTVNTGEQSGDKRRTGATDLTIQGDSNDCKTGKLNVQKEECTTILEPQEHLNRNIAEETSIKQNIAKTDLLHDRRQSQTPPVPEHVDIDKPKPKFISSAEFSLQKAGASQDGSTENTSLIFQEHVDIDKPKPKFISSAEFSLQKAGASQDGSTENTSLIFQEHVDIDKLKPKFRSSAELSLQKAGASQDGSTENTSLIFQDSNSDTTKQKTRPKAEVSSQKHGKSPDKSANNTTKLSPAYSDVDTPTYELRSSADVSSPKAGASPNGRTYNKSKLQAKKPVRVSVEQQPTVNTGKQSDDKKSSGASDLTIQGDAHDCKTGELNDLQQQENKDVQKEQGESEQKAFRQVLIKLGLEDKYPEKISIRDVIAVDLKEAADQDKKCISVADIPWLMLKRMICAHSDFRDMTASKEKHTKHIDNVMSFISYMPKESQDISPLDIFLIVFQCCDPFLKQIFFQKSYLCKIAVPFLYKHWETNKSSQQVICIWPLRSLAIENKWQLGKNRYESKEDNLLELKTKVLAFARFGRPRYSKSKLLNSLLSNQGCKTFFNVDCPSGMTPKILSNGHIEIFWLPLVGDKKDSFQDVLTFMNMRGDLNKNFDVVTLSFIADFVDAVTIIIDRESICKLAKEAKAVLSNFSSVILIIADPLTSADETAIHSFQSELITANLNIKFRMLSTHNGFIELNVVDMVSYMSEHITSHLRDNCSKSFQERLDCVRTNAVKTDEQEKHFQHAKNEAKMLVQQMNRDSDSRLLKQYLTPVLSTYSKKLGILIKTLEREKVLTEVEKIDSAIKEVRQTQTQSITKSVKLFIDILMRNATSPLELKLFLGWLHFYIERAKRATLPVLMHENRLAWEKLKTLKIKKNIIQSEIDTQEIVIKQLDAKIDDASFCVEHFFREIGHIYEAVLELNERFSKFELPPIDKIAKIMGRLVAEGHQLELIDGESFCMSYLWTQTVLMHVDQCIAPSKVMTLSVLGLQSSGKSTLLNTMFGSQFATRTGRCTRGIHIQLIPTTTVRNKKIPSTFDYVLVVDTEGLRSPELSDIRHEHDNELATVITGVGDLTLLNIMGENTSEIRDILQVIIHAILRLKMTNRKLDMRKSCAFIFQNVTDTSASEKMISGLSKLMQTLDEMTKEAARSEGILDINTFNNVIEFDINSQVWYLKNLWQGNPPMAKVNNEYSEKVVDIKCKILQNALHMTNKSYKNLSDILENAHSLWKGVLNEDFVFSFRNSLEIRIYMDMERVVQDELWRLESSIRERLVGITQNTFASCNQEEYLQNVADNLIDELNNVLAYEKSKTENKIQQYFEKNKYKDILIQWRHSQQCRIDVLCLKLERIIREQIQKSLGKRSLEILTVANHTKHEKELRRRSMEVANQYKRTKLSQIQIDSLFTDIWRTFITQIGTSSYSAEQNRKKMQHIFKNYLYDKFKEHRALLKEHVIGTENLNPIPNLKKLGGSFQGIGIVQKDISFTLAQNVKEFFGVGNALQCVNERVNTVLEAIDGSINRIRQVNEEITEMTVHKFMHELNDMLQSILIGTTGYEFKITFYIKVNVHVSRYTHPLFEMHNENYFKTQGIAVRLEQYRVQQKISFEAHLNDRLSEDIAANLFSNVIETFAEEWTSQNLTNKVTDELYSALPCVKNRVIIDICTDLLETENFDKFIRYLCAPKEYASLWITEKANCHLFTNKTYATLAAALLNKVFKNVHECLGNLKDKYTKPPSMAMWIDDFQKSLRAKDISIQQESFRNVKMEVNRIENVEYLTDEILANLYKSEERLKNKFTRQGSGSIKWANANPIDRIIKRIWGCSEQCPFCGEPCAKNDGHDGSVHYSIQHRPSCCYGVKWFKSKEASLESCDFKVQSDIRHQCGLLNYKCNNGTREPCSDEWHPYRDYKKYFPDWDIAPTSNMHDTSKFWMWFVATYKKELHNYYKYEVDNIPLSWVSITKDEAKKSLLKSYSIQDE